MSKVFLVSGPVLGFALLMCTPAWADLPCVGGNTNGYLCVSPSSASVVEGTQNISLPFTVTNKTSYDLILDYARWSITWGGPDTDDNVVIGTLASAPLSLAIGATGTYDWLLDSNGNPDTCPDDCDFGVDPVSFEIEMSPGDTPGSENPTVLSDLLSLTDPEGTLLYSNGIMGYSTVDGSIHTVGDVTVNDPEPCSTLMFGAYGMLGLLGCVWRKRRS